MSTVIAFPPARDTAAQAVADRPRAELSGPRVVILPVVRIERHGNEGREMDREAEREMERDAGAPVRLDAARAPRGVGPSGRAH
ncbi:hypothetical protein [Xanthobacter agilis]|uniref:Uncharacterized protein n=1 Tax=Xanthobacter agilis TaxID=47492 RepID=A0ABU0LDK3_XANAG|nr:hypothetical protein [Xanthobacter agilis]